jgi:acyl-CoA synthetase (AMP-forming)/AMP-acid ligase II
VVSLNPGKTATEKDLIDFCAENIASYKKPRSVDFVDDLPKSNYGKILKRKLRDKYWQDQKRNV